MSMMKKGARVPSMCKCVKCGVVQNPFQMVNFGINGEMSKGVCVECSKEKTEDDKDDKDGAK